MFIKLTLQGYLAFIIAWILSNIHIIELITTLIKSIEKVISIHIAVSILFIIIVKVIKQFDNIILIIIMLVKFKVIQGIKHFNFAQ